MNRPTPTLPLPATPEQQAILQRIVAQRERLKAHRAALQQLRKTADDKQPSTGETHTAISGPLLMRLMAFARLHPLFTATVVAAAVAAGPHRLGRFGNAVLPWLGRLR